MPEADSKERSFLLAARGPAAARGRRRPVLLISVLLQWLLLSACQGSKSAQTEWRLQERWRTSAGAVGPVDLLRIYDMAALPDGRLVVLEGSGQRVVVLSEDGVLERAFGRRGAGPGEFLGATGLEVTPQGEILVADVQRLRLQVFSDTGLLLREAEMMPSTARQLWRGVVDSRGVLWEPFEERQTSSGVASRGWWRRSTAFAEFDTVRVTSCSRAAPPYSPRTVALVTSPPRGLFVTIPFSAPTRSSVVTRDGHEWSGSPADSLALVKRALGSCEVSARAPLPVERVPIEAKDRAAIDKHLREYPQKVGAAPLDPEDAVAPTHLPRYLSVDADDSGRLWVLYQASSGLEYLVVSGEGVPLGRVAVPVRVDAGMPVVISGDRLYVVAFDADDAQYIVAYDVIPGGR